MSQSPQLGYNHNIPHRGRLYHVQTEDSGLKKAHIFTHVFYDGTIIASNKVEYDPGTQVANVDAYIIGLMQDSHKQMIRLLRRGEFDEKIVRYIGEHPEGPAKPSGSDDAPAKAQAASELERPESRPAPEPRAVEPQGPPLQPTTGAGPVLDPTLQHPVYGSAEAQAQVAAGVAAPPTAATRGPRRLQRRVIGGIGGKGVAAGSNAMIERRDVIVGKFASEHQVALDEEILALLREE